MANILLWLLLALIWSSSFGAIKLGIETIAPMPLVAGRMVIGAAIMLAILKGHRGALSKNVNTWITYTISGLAGSVLPFFLISYGESRVDSGLAAISMGIAPIATVLVAPLIIPDEKLTTSSIAGIFFGIMGLIILVGPEALQGIGEHMTGQISILCAALCYAFTTIYVRRYATSPALEMATGSMLVGAIVITSLTLATTSPSNFPIPSLNSISAMVYLGIFPTAIATLLYFHLIPRLGASRMSQINFAVPIGGALIGVLLLGEELKLSSILALALMMYAIYLVTLPSNIIISKKIPPSPSNEK